MRRRKFITLLGGATLWPLQAKAQRPATPLIGFLHQASNTTYQDRLAGFREGLKAAGFVEGHNVAVEYRWAEGRYDRLPAMAADLVRRRAAVITASLLPAAQAAQRATTTIPIVFHIGSDPIKAGLVSSLARPGGNLTGFTRLSAELGAKRLEILRELVPAAKSVAFLVNTANPNAETITQDTRAAAHKLGLQLHLVSARNVSEIDTAFETIARIRPDGILVGNDAFFNDRAEQLAGLATRHRIPAIFSLLASIKVGGLISYGAGNDETDRLVGIYIGRLLKGEKVADLPVQQVTKIELVVNLKAAKALGITVPMSLLGRADEVIE